MLDQESSGSLWFIWRRSFPLKAFPQEKVEKFPGQRLKGSENLMKEIFCERLILAGNTGGCSMRFLVARQCWKRCKRLLLSFSNTLPGDRLLIDQ